MGGFSPGRQLKKEGTHEPECRGRTNAECRGCTELTSSSSCRDGSSPAVSPEAPSVLWSPLRAIASNIPERWSIARRLRPAPSHHLTVLGWRLPHTPWTHRPTPSHDVLPHMMSCRGARVLERWLSRPALEHHDAERVHVRCLAVVAL
eukprot:CAMPEP_0175878222 /NCGR_PEP_ID=MMETSP0107_2-20121207/41053_1 /TAXON_ID=195067 ORGANISM="Goniomonas pacifica, Strain CCMP1869" /NCGR_SAMPLE_ID=MMETSP0107_2 /ASSEMBLY_ACC=CAM_ASM_000203 /LENGTH=147 /DNA_ID=CAMNT_0017197653 /DNA_START=401 /DNA_END=842 /DNA_ORIENTATION=-